MRVLVTGGAGYVGSVLTRHLLNRGYEVRVIDALIFGGESLLGVSGHVSFEFVKADVRDSGSVRDALSGMDAVIHLAAIAGEPPCEKYPKLARTTNLDATVSLVDIAKQVGIPRFLFISTCGNYGTSDPNELADEDVPLNPIGLYAETKVAAEEYVTSAADDEFSASVLRSATAFGISPRMRFDTLLNELVRDAACRGSILIYGPNSWRPFAHVEDIARAFEAALQASISSISGRTFNLGMEDGNYQKGELAQLIIDLVPSADVEILEGKVDPRSYRVSFAKIAKVIGFAARKTVADGIREMALPLINGIIGEPFTDVYDSVSSPAIIE